MDLMNYASDPVVELEGARVELDDVTTIVVARYGNDKFRNMRNRLIEPYQRKSGKEVMNTKQADAVLVKCLAATILLGWEGLFIDGEEFPYSRENAELILGDPRFKQFKEVVVQESNNQENYRLERLEDDLGNFGKSSSTAHAGKKSSKKRTKRSK